MILGIDGALHVSGWAVITNDGKELVDSGTWSTKSTDDLVSRLDDIIQHIEAICAKYEIDGMVFEDVQEQQRNVLTYRKLVSVSTIIEYWAEFAHMKWIRMNAPHWRKIITDTYGVKFGKKREEQKETSVKLVKDLLGKDVTNDESDAILIALACVKSHELDQKYEENAF